MIDLWAQKNFWLWLITLHDTAWVLLNGSATMWFWVLTRYSCLKCKDFDDMKNRKHIFPNKKKNQNRTLQIKINTKQCPHNSIFSKSCLCLERMTVIVKGQWGQSQMWHEAMWSIIQRSVCGVSEILTTFCHLRCCYNRADLRQNAPKNEKKMLRLKHISQLKL